MKRVFGTLVAVPVGAMLYGCGDDDGDRVDAAPQPDAPPGGPDAAAGLSCTPVIGTNHGHAMEVPAADVEAGLEKTYRMTVGGDHDHMLTLSAANMTTLSGGGSVTVQSTNDTSGTFGAHSHSVTVTCA